MIIDSFPSDEEIKAMNLADLREFIGRMDQACLIDYPTKEDVKLRRCLIGWYQVVLYRSNQTGYLFIARYPMLSMDAFIGE